MLERLTERSRGEGGDDVSAADLGDGGLAELLDEWESIQYVLAGSGAIKHTTNGRSTTFEPSHGATAYAVVTNRHLYYVLGRDPESAEVTYPHAEITTAELRRGLLKTTLFVKDSGGSVRFAPADPDHAATVADYLTRMAGAWGDFEDARRDAEAAIEEIEQRLENGRETARLVQAAKSHVSKAYHAATHEDDAPTTVMTALIEPVETELDRLCVCIDAEEIEGMLASAREAKRQGDHETAFATLARAHSTIADRRSAVTDGGVLEPITELGSAYDELVTMTFEDAEAACHRAQRAADPADAVAAWDEAKARYEAALTADWDGEANVSADALRCQLLWVAQRLVYALVAHADALEAAGADDDDPAALERATERLERARDLAGQHEYLTAPFEADRIMDLESQIELTEWEWGDAEAT